MTQGLKPLSGQLIDADAAAVFWQAIRDQQHEFFATAQAKPLWRVVTPPAAPLPDFTGELLLEWQGGLRWLRHDNADCAELCS